MNSNRFAMTLLLLLFLPACSALLLSLPACTASQPAPSPSPMTIVEIDRGRNVAVQEALKGDPELAGEMIKVTAIGTTVKLDGTVQTADEKERAEKLARGIRGVQKVENNLEVKPRQ